MKAIVFADRNGLELGELARAGCPALLPVAGKAVIEHTIEDLVSAGIHDLTVVLGPRAQEIGQRIGDGARWGARIGIATARPGESPSSVLRGLGEPGAGPVLCLRGDVLRSASVAAFLEQAAEAGWQGGLAARAARRNAWMMLVGGPEADLAALDAGQRGVDGIKGQTVSLPNMQVEPIADAEQYFRTCLKASAGLIRGLVVAGYEVKRGQRLGCFSRAPAPSERTRCVHVGDRSRVAETVQTGGTVVVGDDCYVDEHTRLVDCVVLPGTYVGSGLDVCNAVIGPGYLARIDLGVTIPINDPLWSAPMQPDLSGLSTGIGARLAGLCLLLLSLPLWPLALLLSLRPGGAPLRSEMLVGNRRTPAGLGQPFMALQFRTRVPVLRNLPLLLAVIQGHLRMFGARPAGNARDNVADLTWETIRARLPAGLLGPSLLHLPHNAPEEEIYLNEVVFTQSGGLLHRLSCLRDALLLACSLRAWQRTGAAA